MSKRPTRNRAQRSGGGQPQPAGSGLRLILTHEQADFDALASLVAAKLLDPEGLAVLPRRLNKNVRAFLTLYADQLPLVEYDDLPRGKLTRLTLLDMQNLPSVKGLTDSTELFVVDHHPRSEGLDPAWKVQCEEVGATTTLLTEALIIAEAELDVIRATLLLLGIYEDTGSLSYLTTTPRDIRACAWLLECGASLGIAGDFLNHPLSEDQRKLYDRLLESAEIHECQGLSVVIACAAAEGTVDEISTLAHRLRDLYDPAGMFVIVALNGSVQLVARSTTDSLDVGKVAEHFGGGGHTRAAAALVRDRSPEAVKKEIIEILPALIMPVKTVGEIMSHGPQVLSPDTDVAEAASRMQRSGHEGYPIVKGGQVIGLLTRRAVDRAMSHQMGNRPVSSVMDAGTLVVHPGDSVQHLQRVMIQHQWGQVPVADPQTGEIIGIVTRTDLIKTLAPPPSAPETSELVRRLEAALPAPRLRLLKIVAEQAEAKDAALYIVGGFVRDLLLGAPSVDFDLVVEGDAIALAQALAASYGGRVSSHRRFGTAKWRPNARDPRLAEVLGVEGAQAGELPRSVDFVAARTEFYTHPTALPSVERGSIKLDLHRRDFTINTLALRLDGRFYGQLLDHWGGGRDLEQGLIRALHSLSFIDDPTRMLRAVRLEQRLGFTIEARTLDLLQQALSLMSRVSGERIRNELRLIIKEPRFMDIMNRLQALGLLVSIHPSLIWDEWARERVRQAMELAVPAAWNLPSGVEKEILFYALMVFRLPEEEGKSVVDRLRFPASEKADLLEARSVGEKARAWSSGGTPSELVESLEGAGDISVVAAWIALDGEPVAQNALGQYLSSWRYISPHADGEMLRALGLRPGPAYRSILWSARAAWLDGNIKTRDEEEDLVRRLVQEAAGKGGM